MDNTSKFITGGAELKCINFLVPAHVRSLKFFHLGAQQGSKFYIGFVTNLVKRKVHEWGARELVSLRKHPSYETRKSVDQE
jgi:hypothetical protein